MEGALLWSWVCRCSQTPGIWQIRWRYRDWHAEISVLCETFEFSLNRKYIFLMSDAHVAQSTCVLFCWFQNQQQHQPQLMLRNQQAHWFLNQCRRKVNLNLNPAIDHEDDDCPIEEGGIPIVGARQKQQAHWAIDHEDDCPLEDGRIPIVRGQGKLKDGPETTSKFKNMDYEKDFEDVSSCACNPNDDTKSKADDAADEGPKGSNLTTSNLTTTTLVAVEDDKAGLDPMFQPSIHKGFRVRNRRPGPIRALYEENKISFELYQHAVKHQMDLSIERLLAKRAQDASTACNKVLKLNSKFKPCPSCNPSLLKKHWSYELVCHCHLKTTQKIPGYGMVCSCELDGQHLGRTWTSKKFNLFLEDFSYCLALAWSGTKWDICVNSWSSSSSTSIPECMRNADWGTAG